MHFIKYRHQQTALSIFNLPSDVGFNTGDKDRLSNQVDAEAWTQSESGRKAETPNLMQGDWDGGQEANSVQDQEAKLV